MTALSAEIKRQPQKTTAHSAVAVAQTLGYNCFLYVCDKATILAE
jgi:hypothetical protein